MVNIPTFPSCPNPNATLRVKYDTGIHGIVGDTSNHTGSDTVYTLDQGNIVQCYCDSENSGIQTNWIKANNFSQEDIQILKNQGWFYIPNGSLWGLDEAPYMAQNINFNCQQNSNTGGGQVLSSAASTQNIGGQILGLSNTSGNYITTIFTSLFFLLLGVTFLQILKKLK
ncbi:hypothetical protein HYS03_00790 [Candidatus Woesebacteria bacterium]|nr:hypothetical protein [Candidatus Woesebacteria bacterium]QQG47199.1 MAG: hypothetical protein HY044_03605 [Candidatus Woesebacteria bacterium]